MPTVVRPLRGRRDELGWEEKLELLIGPHHTGSAFADDRARYARWLEYRDELMDRPDEPGMPWAFWQYEAPPELHADHSTAATWRDFAERRRAWLDRRGAA